MIFPSRTITQPMGTSSSFPAFFACRIASFIYFSSSVSIVLITPVTISEPRAADAFDTTLGIQYKSGRIHRIVVPFCHIVSSSRTADPDSSGLFKADALSQNVICLHAAVPFQCTISALHLTQRNADCLVFPVKINIQFACILSRMTVSL